MLASSDCPTAAHNCVYFCKLIFNLIYVSVGGPWGSSGNAAKVTSFTRQTQNKHKGNTSRSKIKVENKNIGMQAYTYLLILHIKLYNIAYFLGH